MDYGRLETAHTRTLAWIFEPKNKHDFKDKMAKALIAKVFDRDIRNDFKITLVQAEYSIRKRRRNLGRIDLWIEGEMELDEPFLVVIEAKINADEGHNQLKHYDDAVNKWQKSKNGDVKKIFLTLDGREATSATENSKWLKMNYAKMAKLLWDAERTEESASGYDFLRLYIAGILHDILGWSLPIRIDNEMESPYQEIQLLSHIHLRETK